MKKYSFVFLTICICLLTSTKIWAAGKSSEIGTSVPTTHTIAFESEHASVEYLDNMQKGGSAAYPVPRFSEPSFRIQTDTCWSVKKVLLDEVDITDQMTADGVLKLDRVSRDRTVTIECQESHTWGAWIPDGNGYQTRVCIQKGCAGKETQKYHMNHETETGTGTISSADTGDNNHIMMWCVVWTLSVIWIVGWCLRKKDI